MYERGTMVFLKYETKSRPYWVVEYCKKHDSVWVVNSKGRNIMVGTEDLCTLPSVAIFKGEDDARQ